MSDLPVEDHGVYRLLTLMRQSFRYFLLGEGETGLMVYTILQHLWEVAPTQAPRPCLFLMSD